MMKYNWLGVIIGKWNNYLYFQTLQKRRPDLQGRWGIHYRCSHSDWRATRYNNCITTQALREKELVPREVLQQEKEPTPSQTQNSHILRSISTSRIGGNWVSIPNIFPNQETWRTIHRNYFTQSSGQKWPQWKLCHVWTRWDGTESSDVPVQSTLPIQSHKAHVNPIWMLDPQ